MSFAEKHVYTPECEVVSIVLVLELKPKYIIIARKCSVASPICCNAVLNSSKMLFISITEKHENSLNPLGN